MGKMEEKSEGRKRFKEEKREVKGEMKVAGGRRKGRWKISANYKSAGIHP